jgi:hypothetical protein
VNTGAVYERRERQPGTQCGLAWLTATAISGETRKVVTRTDLCLAQLNKYALLPLHFLLVTKGA